MYIANYILWRYNDAIIYRKGHKRGKVKKMKLGEIFDNHYEELSNEAKELFKSSDQSVAEMEFESVKDYNDFARDVYDIRDEICNDFKRLPEERERNQKK